VGSNRAREEDVGWVLISSGDRVLYFATPAYRTKRFFWRLAARARIAQLRVLHRPLCPESDCRAYMTIAKGKGLKSRYWTCERARGHTNGKHKHVDWDVGLSKEALMFVEKERRDRARYRARVKREGKDPLRAFFIRKPWRIMRPENLL